MLWLHSGKDNAAKFSQDGDDNLWIIGEEQFLKFGLSRGWDNQGGR